MSGSGDLLSLSEISKLDLVVKSLFSDPPPSRSGKISRKRIIAGKRALSSQERGLGANFA
jgi:hypothetical protein